MSHWFVRRVPVVLLVLVSLTGVATSSTPDAGATTPAACATSALSVVAYGTTVAAGTVGQLFWVADTGAHACTLHGYANVSFSGNYGFVASKKAAVPLAVSEQHGRHYTDIAGVAMNRAPPTVTLSPGGAIASFWIFGTDEPHEMASGRSSRCIASTVMYAWMTGSRARLLVEPVHAGGFDWCGPVTVYPVVAGDTGSDPPYPLGLMFGAPA